MEDTTKEIAKAEAIEQYTKLLNDSLNRIEEWSYDFKALEEILKDNHRAWELLLKSFRLIFNGESERGHRLIEQIDFIKENELFHIKVQNLEELFNSKIFRSYFELLDNLFANTLNRYSHISEMQGKSPQRNLVDSWLRNNEVITEEDFKGDRIYTKTRETILEINRISLRYIALHFSHGIPEVKRYSGYFSEIYKYWSDKFL